MAINVNVMEYIPLDLDLDIVKNLVNMDRYL